MIIRPGTKSLNVGKWINKSAFECEDEVVKFGISGVPLIPRTDFSSKLKEDM